MSPFVKGLLVGAAGYWAIQHFSGALTSGLGARQSPGGGKTPGG